MAGISAKLPPLKNLDYLGELAIEIGLYETTWSDIYSWSKLTGTPLQPWEANAIKRMAVAYTNGVGEFDGKNVPSPWHDGTMQGKKTIADKTKKALK